MSTTLVELLQLVLKAQFVGFANRATGVILTPELLAECENKYSANQS